MCPSIHSCIRQSHCQVGLVSCMRYAVLRVASDYGYLSKQPDDASLRGLANSLQPPHGPDFKRWAVSASGAHPDLPVTTCHQYDIHVPFHYQCLNPE